MKQACSLFSSLHEMTCIYCSLDNHKLNNHFSKLTLMHNSHLRQSFQEYLCGSEKAFKSTCVDQRKLSRVPVWIRESFQESLCGSEKAFKSTCVDQRKLSKVPAWIRQSFQEYLCESDKAFKSTCTNNNWNYAYNLVVWIKLDN